MRPTRILRFLDNFACLNPVRRIAPSHSLEFDFELLLSDGFEELLSDFALESDFTPESDFDGVDSAADLSAFAASLYDLLR